jgi:hypothetical protein
MITERGIGKSLAEIHSGKPARAFSAALFTDLTLRDDFNRSNEDPLSKSGEWITSTVAGATVTLEVSSNQCAQLDATTTGYSAWATPFGANQAAAITILTLPADADDFISIHLRSYFQAHGGGRLRVRDARVPERPGDNRGRLHQQYVR